MEQHLLTFRLPMIMRLDMVQGIVALGYHRTGNKFSVCFNGSKGYLSHIMIRAEGVQHQDNNIIWVERLRTKAGQLRSVDVQLYHSERFGVRIAIPADPRCEGNKSPDPSAAPKELVADSLDDLPF